MLFNSRKPIEVDIDNVKFIVKKLTALQQAEVMDALATIKSNVDLVKVGHMVLNFSLVDIDDLFDDEGNAIKPEREGDRLTERFLDGIGVPQIQPIVSALLKASSLTEDLKKK